VLVDIEQPPMRSQAPHHTVMPFGPNGKRWELTQEDPIQVIQLQSKGHSFHEMQQKIGVGKLPFIALSSTGTRSSMYGLCGKCTSEK